MQGLAHKPASQDTGLANCCFEGTLTPAACFPVPAAPGPAVGAYVPQLARDGPSLPPRMAPGVPTDDLLPMPAASSLLFQMPGPALSSRGGASWGPAASGAGVMSRGLGVAQEGTRGLQRGCQGSQALPGGGSPCGREAAPERSADSGVPGAQSQAQPPRAPSPGGAFRRGADWFGLGSRPAGLVCSQGDPLTSRPQTVQTAPWLFGRPGDGRGGAPSGPTPEEP